MIVLDASVVVELLTNSDLANSIRGELYRSDEAAVVPHLLDVEVLSAIRSLVAAELAELPAERYSHVPFLARIWELRHNSTPYDAAYIALAEATGATLYTSDAKLAKGHRARVLLFGR